MACNIIIIATQCTLSIVECSFVLTPSENTSLTRLGLFIVNESSVAMTYTVNNTLTAAQVADKSMNKVSNCNITSLEVYRGRRQAIDINYSGFYLNDSGVIMVSD